jgi:hypothetical protein
MKRDREVVGRWICIVAVVLGILCVLATVPRREAVVQSGARNVEAGH